MVADSILRRILFTSEAAPSTSFDSSGDCVLSRLHSRLSDCRPNSCGVRPDQAWMAFVEIVFRLSGYCREGFFPEMEIAADHVNQTQELR